MRAHWGRQDYDAMERKQLWFTSDDVDLIRDGLNALKVRGANSSPGTVR
jgi:hypothetical protein